MQKLMTLSKDLREMNEEQFVEVYEFLRKNTINFTKIDKSLIRDNPQYLMILRLSLGISQYKLSSMLGSNQWVRHVEAGRQGYKTSKKLEKCIEILNNLFAERGVLPKEKILENWMQCKNARDKWLYEAPKMKYDIKRFNEMSIEGFKKYFGILSKQTKNFTKFDEKIIELNPRFLTIYRIVLGMNIYEFGEIIDKGVSDIRRYERFEDRMMPQTMKIIISKIKEAFYEKNLIGKVNIDNSIKNFKKLSPFDDLELKIRNLLEKSKIPFQIHANLYFHEKNLNVDFIIPSIKNPLVAIEITKLNQIKRKDIIHRIAYLDHRFQMLKKLYQDISTIMLIKCEKFQEDLVNRIIKREILNTDFYFVISGLKI